LHLVLQAILYRGYSEQGEPALHKIVRARYMRLSLRTDYLPGLLDILYQALVFGLPHFFARHYQRS